MQLRLDGLEQRQVTTTIHAGHECRTRFSPEAGTGEHDDELVPFIQPERVSTATVYAEKSYIFEYKWGQFENEVLGLEGIIENDSGNVINPS